MNSKETKHNSIISRLFSNSSDEKLNNDNQYLQSLFNLVADAFLVINKESNEIIDCNSQFSSLFDFPETVNPKDLQLIQIMMRYLAEDSDNKELLMNNIPDNWEGEATFITYNKSKFFVSIKSNSITKENEQYQLIVFKNISDKRNIEQKLRTYKKSVEKASKAKARFLSSMSHELRTPLNGIIGTSNLILAESCISDCVKDHVNILLYSSEHMLGIINDILDFSKIDEGKMEVKKQPFNLTESLTNNIKTFKPQFKNKNINFIFDPGPKAKDILIKSDEIKLFQVINNLLSNALKFTHEGHVEMKLRILEEDESKYMIRFDVIDTGIGIPEEKLSEIFQGFAQVHREDSGRKYGGTGLGLTISERLVYLFGGKLEVESKPGEGSNFHFTMRFEKATDVKLKSNKNNLDSFEGILDTRGLKILVVEDNEINASILLNFLRKWEIQVKEAENGIHALELLKYHKFDLVLMDLEMPEMDGYTAIKKIRETDQITPVLAFTATLMEDMELLIEELGFNDYVLKPYRPAELKKKILEYAPHRKIDYT